MLFRPIIKVTPTINVTAFDGTSFKFVMFMRRKTYFTAIKLKFFNLTRLLSKAGMVPCCTKPAVNDVDQSDCEKMSVLTS